MFKITNIMMPLRAAQATGSLVILGFTSYVANWWKTYWRDMAPAEINFLLFCSVWSLLALIYVVGTTVQTLRVNRFGNRYAILALDALTMTFWFAGFVALAVFLAARVCFGNVCNVAKAGVAFASFEWLLFAATTAYTGMYAIRAQRVPRIEKLTDEDEGAAPSPNV